jgi:hypothetical protein
MRRDDDEEQVGDCRRSDAGGAGRVALPALMDDQLDAALLAAVTAATRAVRLTPVAAVRARGEERRARQTGGVALAVTLVAATAIGVRYARRPG